VVLHGFLKKTRKTAFEDLALANHTREPTVDGSGNLKKKNSNISSSLEDFLREDGTMGKPVRLRTMKCRLSESKRLGRRKKSTRWR
jgi:hypothetical protein